jgi:type I restriction enzyme R subunit
VVITTIQRLYSMLRGEHDFDPELEEESMFDNEEAITGDPRIVTYNPDIPIEFFDFIVVDECHRSIYNLWRQVLEYFDAYIIGMTATPSKQTFGFFNQNLVMEYTRADAVIDGVNVNSRLYVIRTRITQDGSTIEADGETFIPRRDRRTREQRMELLDEDFEYEGEQLDFRAVAPDQIRTVIRTFRHKVLPEMFPDRHNVPKTLIFAKDDSHAEDIVRITREEFAQGNDFCKKITYRVSGVKPEDLIAEFRNSYNPRIVVTVDMIATGTDVKPIEVLLFLRQVRSGGLFEQMQGRGTRVIDSNDLRVVTPDADEKDFFLIVDAVGVMDTPKADTPTLERKPSTSFPKLLKDIAQGDMNDDTFITLAGRLARLDQKLRPIDREDVLEASDGINLNEIAHRLKDAADVDYQIEAARQLFDTDEPTENQIQRAETQLKQDAADLLTPGLRNLLIEIQTRNEIVIDEISRDEVLFAAPATTDEAAQMVQTFQDFIEVNRDEITALQILYNMPYKSQRLEWGHITELAERLKQPPYRLTPDRLWAAYAELEGVQMGKAKRLLTDLIVLVRHALQPDAELIPYPEQVRDRYEDWLASSGRTFTPEQREWLDTIAGHIGVSLTVDVTDFERVFYDRGGVGAAVRAFGDPDTLRQLVDELNRVLVA